MPLPVTSTALLACSFGIAPAALTVLPISRVTIEKKPAGTIPDMLPMVNIPAFGSCLSMGNPTVAAATIAAMSGAIVPMPCIPVPVSPWTPTAPRTLIGGKPALASGCQTFCTWGGAISVTMPGSTTVQVN